MSNEMTPLHVTDGRSKRWRDAEARIAKANARGNFIDTVDLAIVEHEQAVWDAHNPEDGETLPAQSLYQPYASLVAAGLKPIETRPTRIHYRGPLVICAAQKIDRDAEAAINDRLTPANCDALARLDVSTLGPLGVALALVDVVDCRPLMPEDEPLSWAYGPSRWAWMLENIRPLRPFPVRGHQGRFAVSKKMVMEAVR